MVSVSIEMEKCVGQAFIFSSLWGPQNTNVVWKLQAAQYLCVQRIHGWQHGSFLWGRRSIDIADVAACLKGLLKVVHPPVALSIKQVWSWSWVLWQSPRMVTRWGAAPRSLGFQHPHFFPSAMPLSCCLGPTQNLMAQCSQSLGVLHPWGLERPLPGQPTHAAYPACQERYLCEGLGGQAAQSPCSQGLF
jgi:hypothetical protein